MASEVSQAFKPKIKVESWGGEGGVAATSATISGGVGDAVHLSLSLILSDTKAENEAKEVTSDIVLQRLAKNQISAFQGKTEPDTVVTIAEDDEGGLSDPLNGLPELNFKGYSAVDSIAIAPASVNLGGNAVVDWAEIEHLNYSIYPIPIVIGQNTDSTGLDIQGNSILELIKNTETKLRERWPVIKSELEKSGATQQVATWTKIHERNMKLVPRFHEILTQSEQTIGWSKVQQWFKETKGCSSLIKNKMIGIIMSILTTSGASFMSTLNRLAAAFQCIFVPGSDEKLEQSGRFVNKAYAAVSMPESLSLNLLNMSASAGSPAGLLPVTCFMMEPMANQNTDSTSNSIKNLVIVPKEAAGKGGAIVKAPRPQWWFDGSNPKEVSAAAAAVDEIADAGSASIKPVQSEQQQHLKAMEKEDKVSYDVAQAWTLCHYAWESLKASKVHVTVPGLFRYALGKRYAIYSQGSNVFLFTGFLISVSMSVSVKGGCSSSLTFTHVTFPGFELPGKAEIEAAGLLD